MSNAKKLIMGPSMKKPLLMGLILLCSRTLAAQQLAGLDSLKGLLGKWVGEGTSEVGKGGGYATFEFDLKDKVVVRKNHAEYPATKDRPAVTHDDLMIVYVEAVVSNSVRFILTAKVIPSITWSRFPTAAKRLCS